MIKEEKITRTAIIIISDVIDPKSYEYSKLYDKKFSHGYRKSQNQIEKNETLFLIPIFLNYLQIFLHSQM